MKLKTFIATTVMIGLGISNPNPIYGQTPSPALPVSSANYQLIDRQTATTQALDIHVMAGRATSIDFTDSDETVSYVLLADPSRTVYTLDTPIDSNRSKVVYLRRINELKFPGATTNYITNLQVRTIDSLGEARNYVFNITPVRINTSYIGIRITANPLAEPIKIAGHEVTADDLEAGLQIAIQNNYTSASDPIVIQVRQLIQLARGGTPLRSAAEQTEVSIPIISALARLSS